MLRGSALNAIDVLYGTYSLSSRSNAERRRCISALWISFSGSTGSTTTGSGTTVSTGSGTTVSTTATTVSTGTTTGTTVSTGSGTTVSTGSGTTVSTGSGTTVSTTANTVSCLSSTFSQSQRLAILSSSPPNGNERFRPTFGSRNQRPPSPTRSPQCSHLNFLYHV